jgi:phosphocarrier protein HPr
MAQRSVTIASRVGLHARPAMIFVQAVSALGVPVLIAKPGDEPVDASSILGVMALGAKYGEEVVLEADTESALDELVSLLSRDLDAE